MTQLLGDEQARAASSIYLSQAPQAGAPERHRAKKRPGRRRQWGHDRRTRPMPIVPPPINDRRIGTARLFIVATVVAYASYVVYWFFEDLLNPRQATAVSVAETIVYLLVVSLLSASSLAYLLSRIGFLYRAKSHRRATRAVLDEFFAHNQPTLTALVPSYQEDARVVRNTLLSVALQEYPDVNVVLLIDDPTTPKDRRARELLDAARALPREVEELLAWPANRFRDALAQFEASGAADGLVGPEQVKRLASEYDAAAAWLENLASSQDLVDHVDAFMANHVLRRLARDLAAVAAALRQASVEGMALPGPRARQLYQRLHWTFQARLTSFERKRYVSLSHEPNKAMNLNSYIGLMGGNYREVRTVSGPALVAASEADATLRVRGPDYVLTLDADSVLLPEYCVRLVHLLEQQEHRGDAIAQTPYSAFPGSATRLERVAGATTDVQHIVHQGLTYYDATFWVGANAVIRWRALEDIVDISYLGDWEIKTYIRDRTVIEDTDSTLDMTIHGWRLFNVPERLSYSATPPDFGSLSIQRQRWATGGLLIVPKLRQRALAARRRGEKLRFSERFLRWNYMESITWSSLSLLILLAFPFNATLISPLLGVTALPYFWAMASDLRYCGYKLTDIIRVYSFNLLLVPINLSGAGATLVQAITASKSPFIRTPKVRNRTVTPLRYVVTPYLLTILAGFTCLESYRHHVWENLGYAGLNLVLLLYGIVAFIGIGNSLVDAYTHFKAFLLRPPGSRARRRWLRRQPQAAPIMVDWRSVLDFGAPLADAITIGRGGRGAANNGWEAPTLGQLRTFFQPVVDLSTGETVGYEALTRFEDGVSAERHMADAVAAGQGLALEGMMARAAVAAAASLPAEGWLAVKASARLLQADSELKYLLSGVNRPVLVEVPEPSTSDVLPELREVRSSLPPKALVALDHAGLGHKTLSVLLELRPAFVKLDRSALAGLAEEGERQVHFDNLVKVARTCGASVIATGVETEQQRHICRQLGATLAQGFYFAAPVEAEKSPAPSPAGAPATAAGAAPGMGLAAAPGGAGGPGRAGGTGSPGLKASANGPQGADGGPPLHLLDLAADEGEKRPRLSLARAVAAIAVLAAAGYGAAVKLPQAVEAAYAGKAQTWFAPYVDATLTPSYPFQDRSADPARQVVLGFIVSSPRHGCMPSWGGYYSLAQADQALALGPRVAQLGQEGVGAVISFGGKDNTDLAVGCRSPELLERAYRDVVAYYKVSTLDFDVEGPALSDLASMQRRAVALARFEADMARQHHPLTVWLTLPVEADGLHRDALEVLDAMLVARAPLAGVNIMTMDFAPPVRGPGAMLSAAEAATSSAHSQLQAAFRRYGANLSSQGVWQRMGVTVMIGQNDVPGEVFNLSDASRMARFAKDNGLGRLSMWSLNRDSQCGQGYGLNGVLSNTCSGAQQPTLAFSQTFSGLPGQAGAPGQPPSLLVPAPDTNPANALYPLWLPTAEYEAGYKVVRNGYIYQAKWYNAAQDPAQQWPDPSQSPWELLGPVLPSDHAPALPTLPKGTYPDWSPVAHYGAGKRVLYQGLPFEAKWYNEGVSPGEEAANPFGSPWQPLFTYPGEPAPQ